jgi:hypothetical protein
VALGVPSESLRHFAAKQATHFERNSRELRTKYETVYLRRAVALFASQHEKRNGINAPVFTEKHRSALSVDSAQIDWSGAPTRTGWISSASYFWVTEQVLGLRLGSLFASAAHLFVQKRKPPKAVSRHRPVGGQSGLEHR